MHQTIKMLMINFTKELITEALRFSDMLIVNEVEMLHLKKKFGFDLEAIFLAGIKYVIETKGANGSVLYTDGYEIGVKAVKVKKVVDPTGAGDAYRAGLIHALLHGKSIPDGMRIGSQLGALCVQTSGGQTYKI